MEFKTTVECSVVENSWLAGFQSRARHRVAALWGQAKIGTQLAPYALCIISYCYLIHYLCLQDFHNVKEKKKGGFKVGRRHSKEEISGKPTNIQNHFKFKSKLKFYIFC